MLAAGKHREGRGELGHRERKKKERGGKEGWLCLGERETPGGKGRDVSQGKKKRKMKEKNRGKQGEKWKGRATGKEKRKGKE